MCPRHTTHCIFTLLYAYDRMTRVTFPDGTPEDVEYELFEVAKSWDRQGRLSEMAHDAIGRLTSATDAAGRTVQYIHDLCCGHVGELVDGNGNHTSWQYDIAGRLVEKKIAGVPVAHYEYDAGTGAVSEVRRPPANVAAGALNGDVLSWPVTKYGYGVDGRLLNVKYFTADGVTPRSSTRSHSWAGGSIVSSVDGDVAYEYNDPYGRLTRRVDGTGQTTYTYRPVGGLGAMQLAMAQGPEAADRMTLSYDALGRVTSGTRGAGATAQVNAWAYDAAGRVNGETNPLGRFDTFYDGDSGRVLGMWHRATANAAYSGLGVQYRYGQLGEDLRLKQIANYATGGVLLSQFDYGYDAAGQMVNWKQFQGESQPVFVPNWALGYDAADQLVSVERNQDDVLTSMRYTYDAAGNRTGEQIGAQVKGWAPNQFNQLTTESSGGPTEVRGTVSTPSTVTVAGQPATMNGLTWTAKVPAIVGDNHFPVVATESTPSAGNNAQVTTKDLVVNIADEGTGTFTYDGNGNLLEDPRRLYEWDGENRLLSVVMKATQTRTDFAYDGENLRTLEVEKSGPQLASPVTTIRRLTWAGLSLARITEEQYGTGIAPASVKETTYYGQGELRRTTAAGQ